jgi:hypothetical protein
MIDEQRAAIRVAHRASLEKVSELPSGGGAAALTTGAKVVADIELASDGLDVLCDFLTKVNESSFLGRFSYQPVKVIGTCRASRPDTLGLVYQGLVASLGQ